MSSPLSLDHPSVHINSSLNNKVMFFIWALDDIRCLDQIVWQHLAPHLYPDLQAVLDECYTADTDTLADNIHDIFDRFAIEQLALPPFDSTQWQTWLKKKIRILKEYDKQVANLDKSILPNNGADLV